MTFYTATAAEHLSMNTTTTTTTTIATTTNNSVITTSSSSDIIMDGTTTTTTVVAGTSQNLIDNGCIVHDPNLYSYDYIWPNYGVLVQHDKNHTNNNNDTTTTIMQPMAANYDDLFSNLLTLKRDDNQNLQQQEQQQQEQQEQYYEDMMNQLIQQYHRDGIIVIPNAITTLLTDITIENDNDERYNNDKCDRDSCTKATTPSSLSSSLSSSSTTYHERIISQIDQAMNELIDGTNIQFANNVKQLLNSNIVPDFTTGNKIPWIQYEAGTILSSLSLSTTNEKTNDNTPSLNSNYNTTTTTKTTTTNDLLFTPWTTPYVRKIMGFVNGYSPIIDAIAQHPKLHYLVQRLLSSYKKYDDDAVNASSTIDDDDDDTNDIELFQDMALLKPCNGGREKPWHQDKAYFNVHVTEPVVGCWMAIDPATIENGCLRFELPYDERTDTSTNMPGSCGGNTSNIIRLQPQMHYMIRDYQLCDTVDRKGKVIVVPLQPGGIVLFDGMIPHGTPTNNTTIGSHHYRRRALQLHWIRKNARQCTTSERMNTFGGIPNGTTC